MFFQKKLKEIFNVAKCWILLQKITNYMNVNLFKFNKRIINFVKLMEDELVTGFRGNVLLKKSN